MILVYCYHASSSTQLHQSLINDFFGCLFEAEFPKLHHSRYLIGNYSPNKELPFPSRGHCASLVVGIASGSNYRRISNSSPFFICHAACGCRCRHVSIYIYCHCSYCPKLFLFLLIIVFQLFVLGFLRIRHKFSIKLLFQLWWI